MSEIKLPPLLEPIATVKRTMSALTYKHKTSIGLSIGENDLVTVAQAQAYATAAIEADRQSRDCGQCVPLSTDGKSVFIDGVGEVPLDFGGQARGNADASAVSSEPVAWISDSPTKGNGKRLFWTKTDAWSWSSNVKPLYTARQPTEPDVLPGDAIFGFAAWLTSLKTPVTFSECHGAAIGAELAVAYNTSQGFIQVREDFHKRLKPYPKYEPSQPAEPEVKS